MTRLNPGLLSIKTGTQGVTTEYDKINNDNIKTQVLTSDKHGMCKFKIRRSEVVNFTTMGWWMHGKVPRDDGREGYGLQSIKYAGNGSPLFRWSG